MKRGFCVDCGVVFKKGDSRVLGADGRLRCLPCVAEFERAQVEETWADDPDPVETEIDALLDMDDLLPS